MNWLLRLLFGEEHLAELTIRTVVDGKGVETKHVVRVWFGEDNWPKAQRPGQGKQEYFDLDPRHMDHHGSLVGWEALTPDLMNWRATAISVVGA